MYLKETVAFLLISFNIVVASNSVFDHQLYEDVLDPQMCHEQLTLLMQSPLKYHFYDASFRVPSGLRSGHINDLGDYHLCLGIDQTVQDMQIQGKYCAITVPLNQDPIDWPSLPDWTIPELNVTLPNITWPVTPEPDDEQKGGTVMEKQLERLHLWSQHLAGSAEEVNETQQRIFPLMTSAIQGMTWAVCIPKVCSTTQALTFVQQMTGILNVTFNEYYCRLPNDKPLTIVDYVAICIFSFIGLLIGISTAYDLIQMFYYQKSSSEINPLCRSFSIYTNTRRLLTFNSSPGALDCVDGIRVISMLWVVIGHTYCFTLIAYVQNMVDIYEWMIDFSSTWIIAAPITVDTFFMLSGVLAVYSTIGKISRGFFIRALHLFYLNRFLRMLPLLAAVVLFQASLSNQVADGPFWQNVAMSSENCRKYWWAALLHVQNYVNPTRLCLPQSWYLSVDMQLYYVAPLVLWWLWGRSFGAWTALTIGLLLSLVSSSVISFTNNFSAALANFNRLPEFNDYVKLYYLNTLTRAPPFFVGMLFGYLLHLYKDKKIIISRFHGGILWVLSMLMMSFCVFSIYPAMQPDYTAQIFDNFLNAYMRAIWALALGWVIFACVKGYGGPVNWFLSLSMWKLPARLSYAVYLIHVPIMMINSGTWVKTHYFTPLEAFYRFGSDVMFAFLAAFVLCVCIDAPFSTLQKLLLGGGKKRPQKPKIEARNIAVVETDAYIKTAL